MSLALLLLAAPALAASAAPPSTALDQLARDVAPQLSKPGLDAPIGLYVEGVPAPLGRAVVSALAAQLSASARAPVPIDARSAADAETLARERGVRSLVRLTLTLDAGRLTARGDVISTWVNFWSGRTPTRAGPFAAVVAQVEADAQLLALAGAAPPVLPLPPATASLELRLTPLVKLSHVPAALAAADIDGDKRAELLALVNEELLVFSSDGRQLARARLDAAPPALQPTREPFGGLGVLSGPTRVVAWSARRARAEVLLWAGGALKPQPHADAVPVEGVVAKLDPGFNRFRGDVTWAGKALSFGPFQALSTRGALALLVSGDGTGVLARGAVPASRFGGVGSGATLADLDGDGTPELVATGARVAGDGDDVRVLSVVAVDALQGRAGTVPEAPTLWQGLAPRGRVLVAAAADLDGDGAEEAVLGAWLPDGSGELLLLERVTP